jgi:hypothetical protein
MLIVEVVCGEEDEGESEDVEKGGRQSEREIER